MDTKTKFQTNRKRFETLCRTCMHEVEEAASAAASAIAGGSREAQWQSIFDFVTECGALRIAELLTSTTPQLAVVDASDCLPKKICRECLEQLLSVHRFQQMCIRADQELRSLLVETKFAQVNEVPGIPGESMPAAEVENVGDPLQSVNNAIEECENMMTSYMQPMNCLKIEYDENLEDNREAEEFQNMTDVLKSESVKVQVNDMETESKNTTENPEDSTTAGRQANLSVDKAARLTCRDCGKEFTRSVYLKNHLKRHTAAQAQSKTFKPRYFDSYSCDECPRRFNKPESLFKHRQTHDAAVYSTPVEQYPCDICSKSYTSRRILAKHKRTHEPDQSQQSSGEVPKPYICKYCNKAFQQSCTLKDHERTHTGEQPFLCSECGKAFSSSSNMKQHLLRHAGVKRYECPYCPKKFPCISDLCSHKVIHQNVKPHVCDECGAAFAKPYQLKKHKRYHSGDKPHKCEYCEMRFVCADHMRRHMRTHTGEKPYKCKYCERAFAQSNDLIKHLRSHLGENVYMCELCPRAFRLASELRKHFVVHKDDDEATKESNLKALMEEEARLRANLVGVSHKKY